MVKNTELDDRFHPVTCYHLQEFTTRWYWPWGGKWVTRFTADYLEQALYALEQATHPERLGTKIIAGEGAED